MFIEKLDTKILLLNNQHLGMVMQWEDRFYKVGSAPQLALAQQDHQAGK